MTSGQSPGGAGGHRSWFVRRRGPRFVGRSDELAVLEEELERARAGECRCVLVVGEPGVGKTRLAWELLDRHADQIVGLSARGYPMGTATPFGLWAEGLDPFLRGLSREELIRLCRGYLDDLAVLLHAVAAVRGSAPLTEPPRWRLLEALLVVATGRPGSLREREVAAQVLIELTQDELIRRVELAPFKPGMVGELAEAVLERPAPRPLADWVAARSRGNAFYAIGLVRALAEEGADLTAPQLRRLPESVAQRVAVGIRRLGGPQRSVMELLAVLGRPVEFGTLSLVAGLSAEELGPVLTELAATETVAEDERAGVLSYEIHHPLTREAIYQGLGGARRRVLHTQLARALLKAGRVAEAAPHFARSAEAGDPEAVATLTEAVRRAEQQGAHREALELLGALVDLLPAGDRRWLAVLEAMQWQAEWVVDHRADDHQLSAIRAMRAIDALMDCGEDPGGRAAVKFRLASFLAWGTGELAEAEQHCRQARDLAERAGDLRQRLLAERELAWIRGLRGDLVGMQVQAGEVVAAAAAAGERFVVLPALAAAAYSAVMRGCLDEGARQIERAIELAREDDKAYRLTTIAALKSTCLVYQGRTADALAVAAQAKARDRSFRDGILVEAAAGVHWVGGNYPAAVNAAREALAWTPQGPSRRRALGAAFGALAAVETGEIAEAERFLAHAHATLEGRDWSTYRRWAQHGEAVLAWHGQHHLRALDLLTEAAQRLREMRARPSLVDVLVDLAEVAAEADQPGTAAAVAGELTELAAADHDAYGHLAGIGSAWASLARGEIDQAVSCASIAVARFADTRWHGALGRAHQVLGLSLAKSDRAASVAALERAASLFGDCGSTWRRDRCLDALRALGGPGRRAVAAVLGPGALSGRERDVALLAAAGQTAREMAARLFVSERTIETHLSHVYAKLGVASKVELVRRAQELGLREP
jgi:DNA-binding CsgD family transcriptional regulator